MSYDLFTPDKRLAEQIVRKSDKAYMVDTTDKPDVYQFFNLPESTMYKLRRVIHSNEGIVEVRDSAGGRIIWPSQSGAELEQALDILC